MSLSSRGARVQFEIAAALTSVIPLLALVYFVTRGFLVDGGGFGFQESALVLIIVLVGLGYALLVKYPLTVIRLRRYLEDIVRGELPAEISLDDSEDDITSIQQCMNMILQQLKKKVVALQEEQARLEMQLCQAHKLQAIGTLAAGIAHEMNTPIQFVSDNTKFLSETVLDVMGLLDAHQQLRAECEAGRATAESFARVSELERKVDMEFIEKEVPAAIAQSLEGLSHAAEVARAMKDFSRMVHDDEKTEVDINKAVQTTITVSRNEWKYVADVTTDLDPALPPVPCFPGDIKQVIINLIVNAAHAIGELKGPRSQEKGVIAISTRRDGDHVVIAVRDTGAGIRPEDRGRICEAFFTTKKVGKGTGLGLAIARSIVVNKHHGTLTFETEVGAGTTFVIRLPLDSVPKAPAEGEEDQDDRYVPAEAHLVCG